MLKCLHVILYYLNSLHPIETTTHDLFGSAAFKFLHEPPHTKCKEKHCRNEGKRYCDTCGKALKGFVYHCAARDLDLHPCCRNLETKMDIYGEEFRLQDKVSRLCNWWKKRELEGRGSDVQGWAYAWSNKHYYFHVGCVQEMMLEAWQNEGGGGSDDDKSVAAVSKMNLQLQRTSKGNGGKETSIGRCWSQYWGL